MSAPVVDLAAARERREADRAAGSDALKALAGWLVQHGMERAERAFAVGGRERLRDPDMARIVFRGVRRRLRAKVRSVFGQEDRDDLTAAAVEGAIRAFDDRLLALVHAGDGTSGGRA